MVAFLKASPYEKTYSDYLQAAREAEKEDSMDPSQGPQDHTANSSTKLRATSFFPLQKLKGNQLVAKRPAICLAHLEKERMERMRK